MVRSRHSKYSRVTAADVHTRLRHDRARWRAQHPWGGARTGVSRKTNYTEQDGEPSTLGVGLARRVSRKTNYTEQDGEPSWGAGRSLGRPLRQLHRARWRAQRSGGGARPPRAAVTPSKMASPALWRGRSPPRAAVTPSKMASPALWRGRSLPRAAVTPSKMASPALWRRGAPGPGQDGEPSWGTGRSLGGCAAILIRVRAGQDGEPSALEEGCAVRGGARWRALEGEGALARRVLYRAK